MSETARIDAYNVIRLTRSNAAVWTVDDVARLFELFSRKKNSYLCIYLFFLDRLEVVSRKDATLLAQLRSGHCIHLQAYKQLMDKTLTVLQVCRGIV